MPRKPKKPKMLYGRATAVVVNPQDEVLLVKHNRQDTWSLPGGQLKAAEDPARRAVLEVAEETGLTLKDPRHAGRYAGSVASHEVFIGKAKGEPRPNRRELQDAVWWDGKRPLNVQQHVTAILALVGAEVRA